MKTKKEERVILLRAINVSGKNKLPMAELKSLLAGAGFEQVRTYIQSGNIVTSCRHDIENGQLSEQIHQLIEAKFGYDIKVFCFRKNEFLAIVENQPFYPFVDDLSKYHVSLLDIELDPEQLDYLNNLDQSITQIHPRENRIYMYCSSGYGKTKYHNSFFERKLKCKATTRNWKTMLKIKEMLVGNES